MIPERRRFLAALGAVCLAALYVEANRQAILSSSFASSVARKSGSLPDFLWGVTADEVTDLQAISKSMKALPVMPITRVVFNPPRPPSAYRHAIEAPASNYVHDGTARGQLGSETHGSFDVRKAIF